MLVIGERINASNSSVAEAISNRDESFLEDLARSQAAAGADFIDINAGARQGSRQNEAATMEWLVEIVQAAMDKPLAIDSDDPNIIAAALRKYRGDRLIVNSVTAETGRLASIGSLASQRSAWIVALSMGAEGIPDNVEQRLAACEIIMAHLTRLGMQPEQILFDPLVLPVAVDSRQAMVTLATIQQIKARYPTSRTVAGLSNVSFGLPRRRLINRAFLLMAAHAGLDAAILDPLDARVMSIIKVADVLVGKDPSCRGFLRANRRGMITE